MSFKNYEGNGYDLNLNLLTSHINGLFSYVYLVSILDPAYHRLLAIPLKSS